MLLTLKINKRIGVNPALVSSKIKETRAGFHSSCFSPTLLNFIFAIATSKWCNLTDKGKS